jgi:hypothetical protein
VDTTLHPDIQTIPMTDLTIEAARTAAPQAAQVDSTAGRTWPALPGISRFAAGPDRQPPPVTAP